MKIKLMEKTIKEYNLTCSIFQLKQLYIAFKARRPTGNFEQMFITLIKRRFENNCDVKDYYDIKERFLINAEFSGQQMTKQKYINYYGFTKGKKLYKKYCENKTRKFDSSSEAQRQRSLKYVEKRKANPELYTDIQTNQIGYWLKQGYTEQEAKELLSERQRTFTLKKCIQKYGEERGIEKWKERQKKWQETLNAKTQEEIDDINRRKSYGKHRKWTNETIGKIYYIRFFNQDIEFWKIGITTQEIIGGRFDRNEIFEEKYKMNYEILQTKEFKIFECFNLEQKILKAFNDYRISVDYNGFKTTEAFKIDVRQLNDINL